MFNQWGKRDFEIYRRTNYEFQMVHELEKLIFFKEMKIVECLSTSLDLQNFVF